MSCKDCELWKKAKINCMPTAGNLLSEVLLIGEGPGKTEDDSGIPFVGKSGRLLRQALKDGNITDFAISNVVRCRPFIIVNGREKDRPPSQEEVDACFHYTLEDIDKMPNLKLIVCIGNVALRAFTGRQGITKVSGEEWKYKKIKLMPLIHPSYVLQNIAEMKRFFEHVSRIPRIVASSLTDESDFGEYIIIENIGEWTKLVEKLRASKIFSYDMETNSLNPWDEDAIIKCIQFSHE